MHSCCLFKEQIFMYFILDSGASLQDITYPSFILKVFLILISQIPMCILISNIKLITVDKSTTVFAITEEKIHSSDATKRLGSKVSRSWAAHPHCRCRAGSGEGAAWSRSRPSRAHSASSPACPWPWRSSTGWNPPQHSRSTRLCVTRLYHYITLHFPTIR